MSSIRIFLAGGATMAIALATVFILTGAAGKPRTESFDEITVGRINIVEPDGTKRLILSSRSKFPGIFMQGKEIPHPDRNNFAGIIFLNDEGTENGGLIYRGKLDAKGNGDAALSLTFDRFRQDQSLHLLHEEADGKPTTGIGINDSPDFKSSPITEVKTYAVAMEKMNSVERAAYIERLRSEGKLLQPRLFLGTTPDRNSSLVLKDAKGRPRMVLSVAAAGNPQIQMLDEHGVVVKTVDAVSK
jgi:hypothetical protein